MNRNVLALFSSMEVFRSLPDPALRRMADIAIFRNFPAETVLFSQGRSMFDGVYIVDSGTIELCDERDSAKSLVAVLGRGALFGGIAVLLNGGLCVRTARVVEDAGCWVVPAEFFREVCRAHRAFHQYFVDLLDRRMSDAAYAAIFAGQRALRFLSALPPFSFLPESELEGIASSLTVRLFPADTTICLQGLTIIDHLYIVKHGAALRYFEEDGGGRAGSSPMSEGELFGGISMLINNSVSLRSLKTLEDSELYLWEKAQFLEICDRYDQFLEFFTDTFGKRMLDRSYAAIVAKAIQPAEETLPFLNRVVSSISSKRLLHCPEATSVQEAARRMSSGGSGSILIASASGDIIGIVTDRDLRKTVLAAGLSSDTPVAAIMTSPLKTISSQALIFEAVMQMMQEKIKRLGITAADGRVTGVVTTTDILAAQSHSPLFLLREITSARSLETLKQQHRLLPDIIQGLISSGAKAAHLNRLVTTLFDTTLTCIIEQELEQLGPPPCDFAFLVMGSDGRKEQTLRTDQDNAIVYDDGPESQIEERQHYFLTLGERVCTALDAVGYSFCRGNIMAKNPTWCQPLAVWRDYFSSWIRAAEPEDLLSCSIFFDFRCGYGAGRLVVELRDHLQRVLREWPSFLQFLAFNAHHFKPPIGFFRNFIVESRGEHRNSFDIKKVMVPIVDFARIYALKLGLVETNTQERLRIMERQGAIRPELYHEMEQAYSFLMQLRLSRQVNAILVEKTTADNYINPKKLTRIEQTMLKEIFTRIDSMQKEIAYGLAGD